MTTQEKHIRDEYWQESDDLNSELVEVRWIRSSLLDAQRRLEHLVLVADPGAVDRRAAVNSLERAIGYLAGLSVYYEEASLECIAQALASAQRQLLGMSVSATTSELPLKDGQP
jgi:heme oxygenase